MNLKNRLKIYVFPKLIRGLHKLGFSYEKLGGYSFFAKSNLIAQAKSIGDISIEDNPKAQNIYVLLMLSGSNFHLYIESLLALGLKKKGHNITFIMDHNMLPIHELKKIGNENNWDSQAETDFIFATKFLDAIDLEYISIEEFLKGRELSVYDKKYNSILEATLLKQYKVGVISKDLPLLDQKTELIKTAIMISDEIGKKLVEIKPDSVIMSHGIYSTWGPLFNVLNANNISILVHGRGKKRHSQVFNWNKTGDSWDVSEEWAKVKDQPLVSKELNSINDYLESRISHRDDVFVYNFGKETSNKEAIDFLDLDENKPIYTLFTNVLWDAASAQREIAFNNPVEWVIETIEWFNKHPEKQLIVKIHPAEIVIGTNMPFYEIIINRITPEKNVRIIKPDAKVNSWSIYAISTVGIVHTTTAGMEMPLVNKPCMVVSQTHYREKGFTIDINSKEEYFTTLANFDESSINYDKNRDLALRYSYLLFIRYQIPFNMFFEEISTSISGFRYNNLDDYFTNAHFSNIIKVIENKTPIFNNN